MILLLLACISESSEHTGATDDSGSTQWQTEMCGDVEVDIWASGISRDGDVWRFTVVENDPSPPEKGDNVMTLSVYDGQTPLDNLSLSLAPSMQAHGHGTNPAVVPTTAAGGDGKYLSDPFNLFMGGAWSYVVTASGGSGSDTVEFSFCIEG
jgi:hypothetical protein